MAVTVSKAKIGVCSLGFLGILLLVVGIVALSVLPTIFKAQVQKNLVLAEGKETFEKWKVTPIPVYFSVYLFNCTNPVGVESFGEKPNVQEVGPYVFKQMRSKNIKNWNAENMTVTYDDIKTYHFVESMSADPELIIYTLNMPVLGITKFISNLSYFVRSFISSTLDTMFQNYGETLFIKKKAQQLLFDGYKVDLLEDIVGLIKPFADFKSPLPNNSFAFLFGKNNSGDGRFTVYTGEDDMDKYTQIQSWNNHSRLEWWKDEYCDMLNGTDGSQFPPPVSKTDILYVYTAELCRSVFLEYLEETHVKGIASYRFTTPPRLFASPKQNPNNQCYCTRPNLCDLSGILDITSCREGIPLAITAPHFYLAHPRVSETVDGLKPDKDLHETYVDIEPMTGVVLRASRKLQMNYMLENSEDFRITENVTDAIFPLLWIIEAAEIDENIATMFTSKVKTPVTIAKSVLTACIVLGLLWIFTAGFVTIYILIKQQKASKSTLKATYKAVPLKPEDVNPKSEKVAPVNI